MKIFEIQHISNIASMKVAALIYGGGNQCFVIWDGMDVIFSILSHTDEGIEFYEKTIGYLHRSV